MNQAYSFKSGAGRWWLLIVMVLLLAGFSVWRRACVSVTIDSWAVMGDLQEDTYACGTIANPLFIIELGADLAERFSDDVSFEIRDELLKAVGIDIFSIEDWRGAGFDPEAPLLASIPVIDESSGMLALVVSVGLLELEQAQSSLHDLGESSDLEKRTITRAGYEIHTYDEELFFLVHEKRLYIGVGDDEYTTVRALGKIIDGTSERLADNADFRTVRRVLPKSNVAAYLPLSPLINLLRKEFHLYPHELVWLDWLGSNFQAMGLVADRGYGRIILTFAKDSKFRYRLQPAGSSRVFAGRFGEPLFALNVSLAQPVPLIFGLIEQIGGAEALAEFETELQDELYTDRRRLEAIFKELTGSLLFYGFKGFFEPQFIVFCKVSEETQAMVAEWILKLNPDLLPHRYGNSLLWRDRADDFIAGFVDGYLVFGNSKRHILNVAEGLYADWQPRSGDSLLSFELRVARILDETGEMMPPQVVDAITLLFGEERSRQYIYAELTRTCHGIVLNAETPVLRMLFGMDL